MTPIGPPFTTYYDVIYNCEALVDLDEDMHEVNPMGSQNSLNTEF